MSEDMYEGEEPRQRPLPELERDDEINNKQIEAMMFANDTRDGERIQQQAAEGIMTEDEIRKYRRMV